MSALKTKETAVDVDASTRVEWDLDDSISIVRIRQTGAPKVVNLTRRTCIGVVAAMAAWQTGDMPTSQRTITHGLAVGGLYEHSPVFLLQKQNFGIRLDSRQVTQVLATLTWWLADNA